MGLQVQDLHGQLYSKLYVIPGAKNADQVLHNLRTLAVQLTEAEIQEINRIFR